MEDINLGLAAKFLSDEEIKKIKSDFISSGIYKYNLPYIFAKNNTKETAKNLFYDFESTENVSLNINITTSNGSILLKIIDRTLDSVIYEYNSNNEQNADSTLLEQHNYRIEVTCEDHTGTIDIIGQLER